MHGLMFIVLPLRLNFLYCFYFVEELQISLNFFYCFYFVESLNFFYCFFFSNYKPVWQENNVNFFYCLQSSKIMSMKY